MVRFAGGDITSGEFTYCNDEITFKDWNNIVSFPEGEPHVTDFSGLLANLKGLRTEARKQGHQKLWRELNTWIEYLERRVGP
jgi:hypothetical protein